MRATREGLAREALRPLRPEEPTVRAVGALLDFLVFKSYRRHNIPKEEAEETLNTMMLRWLKGPRDDR